MNTSPSRSLFLVAALLAVGLVSAAYVHGVQVKHIRSGNQSIVVKGLAEKSVQADHAEWTVGVKETGPTFAAALAKLRATQPKLRAFLLAQGFAAEAIKESAESVEPHMVMRENSEGRERRVQDGFEAEQQLTIATRDLPKVETASKALLQFEGENLAVTHQQPQFMVSNLEDVKMSLIGAATQNARARAEEFAKNGDARVGPMRSASQGAFYILAARGSGDDYEYGGHNDKSSIDKLARVVVTIEYSIEN
jgi:hypothetical protein